MVGGGYQKIPGLAFPSALIFKNQLQGLALAVENIGEEIKMANVGEGKWVKNSGSDKSQEISCTPIVIK